VERAFTAECPTTLSVVSFYNLFIAESDIQWSDEAIYLKFSNQVV